MYMLVSRHRMTNLTIHQHVPVRSWCNTTVHLATSLFFGVVTTNVTTRCMKCCSMGVPYCHIPGFFIRIYGHVLVAHFHCFRVVLPSANKFLLPNALHIMNAQQQQQQDNNNVDTMTTTTTQQPQHKNNTDNNHNTTTTTQQQHNNHNTTTTPTTITTQQPQQNRKQQQTTQQRRRQQQQRN